MEETAVDVKHENNRKKVCVICYRKGTRSLSLCDIGLINEHVIQGFNADDQNFPFAICNGCYLLLSKKGSSADVKLPVVDNYDPERPKNLRSSAKCDCKICKVATTHFNDSLIASRKRKASRGQPKVHNETPKQNTFKICGVCFEKLYSGCTHQCSNCRIDRVKNIESLINSPTTSQVLASRVLNETS